MVAVVKRDEKYMQNGRTKASEVIRNVDKKKKNANKKLDQWCIVSWGMRVVPGRFNVKLS